MASQKDIEVLIEHHAKCVAYRLNDRMSDIARIEFVKSHLRKLLEDIESAEQFKLSIESLDRMQRQREQMPAPT